MRLEDVESIARQLDPQDQVRLADGIRRQSNGKPRNFESSDVRRARRLAAIARSDAFAGPDGDRDTVEDLRCARDNRQAEIG